MKFTSLWRNLKVLRSPFVPRGCDYGDSTYFTMLCWTREEPVGTITAVNWEWLHWVELRAPGFYLLPAPQCQLPTDTCWSHFSISILTGKTLSSYVMPIHDKCSQRHDNFSCQTIWLVDISSQLLEPRVLLVTLFPWKQKLWWQFVT